MTGIGGEAWEAAAAEIGAELGLDITAVAIGPGKPVEHPYGTWADLREIDDAGVLLVRPELHVSARSLIGPADTDSARSWLEAALRSELGC